MTLKIPWRDGTTHLCFEPIALLERLTADRLTRYHTKRLAALGYAVTLTKRAAWGRSPPNLRRICLTASATR